MNTIIRGTADYVQVIHSHKGIGIWDQIGDVDIYVKYEGIAFREPLEDRHGIAFFLHLGTSTKRMHVLAELNENRNGIVSRQSTDNRLMLDTVCEVGIYAVLKEGHRGKKLFVGLIREERVEFWMGIDPKFLNTEIFLGSDRVQSESRRTENQEEPMIVDSDEDEDCIICCTNKKNALLIPCEHQETCCECWDAWKNEPTSENRCPYCKQFVEECIEKETSH